MLIEIKQKVLKRCVMQQDRYWNALIETLPQEKLRELQFKKFKRIFTWAYEKSKFHRSLYDSAGIKPGI